MQASLASAARATISAACRAAGAHEACGLLFGRRSGAGILVERASLAANVAAEPWHRFELDPAHLLAAQRQARAALAPAVVGVWHSHPNGPLVPSAEDLAGGGAPGWLWIIADATGARLAAFLRAADGKALDPVPLRRPRRIDLPPARC